MEVIPMCLALHLRFFCTSAAGKLCFSVRGIARPTGWFCRGTCAYGKGPALLPGVRQLIHHVSETSGHLPQ